jgi:signal transduction histidine kinase
MSTYDDLENFYENRSAKERLAALRHEMITPLATIQGFAILLARINLEDQSTFPKDYGLMVERILQAHNHIRAVLDELTSTSPSK